MTSDPKVRELLAPMHDRQVDLSGRRFKVDREKVVARMMEASAAKPYRRVHPMFAVAAGLALVGSAAGLIATRRTPLAGGIPAELDVIAIHGTVTRLHAGGLENMAAGQTIGVAPEGSVQTSAESEARIKTHSDLTVELRPNTRVSLAEMTSTQAQAALHLDAGSVRCVVPHLSDGHTFSVVTPDARILDRGTIFNVALETSGAKTRTTVRVEEGKVLVQLAAAQVELSAGETWSSSPPAEPALAPPALGSLDKSAPAMASASANRPLAPAAAMRRGTTGEPRGEPPAPLPGTLDEETRLLREGLAAERRGAMQAAAASFDLLLSRYPDSPLAPDARAARARVLKR